MSGACQIPFCRLLSGGERKADMDPESRTFGLQSKVYKDEFSVSLNSEQLSSTPVIKYVTVPFSFMKLELLTSSFYFDWR
jgi:hypothetical protein